MSQTKMSQKQMTLAETARNDPAHRFANLYSLMHWDDWIRCAADAVLARPGSSTAGVDGKTRDNFKDHYWDEITALVESLKHKTYEPQPVRRVYIPKSNGRKRPLGIPMPCAYCPPCRQLGDYGRVVREAWVIIDGRGRADHSC